MMVAVLLGALSLGACVDDNESASVTNIRNAKAEQLSAMATLYQAQAEAAASAAAAEAQLKAAEAAYQQALADAAAADAAMKEELLRQAQEKFAFEIQAIEAEYAMKVAKFNSLRAQYEKQLWANEDAHIQAVYNGYVTAQSAVNTFTQDKMEQQVIKAQLEAAVIPADEAVRQQINNWNTELKQLQRDLAKLEAMKEAQPSKDEYLTMLDEIERQAYEILNNGARTAIANETSKKNAFTEAKKELELGTSYAFVLAAQELAEIQDNKLLAGYLSHSFVANEDIELAEAERDAYLLKWQNAVEDNGEFTFTNKYDVVSTNVDLATLRMNNAFADALEAADENIEKVTGEEWEVDATTSEVKWGDYQVTIDGKSYYTVNGVKGYIAYYEKAIADAQKEVKRLETVIAGENAKGDNKDQILIDRCESQIAYWEFLIDGTTDPDYLRYDDGQGYAVYYYLDDDGQEQTYNTYYAIYEEELSKADDYEIQAQAALNQFTEDKTEITDLQKEYQAALADFNKAENQKAYTDAIAALETPAKEYVAAQDAAEEYEDQLADLGFETSEYSTTGLVPLADGTGAYNEIKSVLDGIYDVQSLIDAKNQQIANITSMIQSSTALGQLVTIVEDAEIRTWNPVTGRYETIGSGVAVVLTQSGITFDDAIALADAQIALLDAKIEAQQALADKYKAQLDTLLTNGDDNTDTPVEPETPADDEEQPAA